VKLLVLTKYGRLGASSRVRFFQYLSSFQQVDFRITLQPLLSDDFLSARYQSGSYGLWSLLRAYVRRLCSLMSRKNFDLVWIEKESLPWVPLWFELSMLRGVPFVLDYDDAVFHNYDQHARAWVRRLFGYRLDGLMAQATLVMGGNNYLAQRASAAGACWVEVVPTVVDLERYTQPFKDRLFCDVPRIVWIGSPTTAAYLQLIREPLRVLAARKAFILRVIGGGAVDLPGVQVESVPWSEAAEVESISACQVGVMPLQDSLWERGKCGYKLIQYMACGLPVVASAVGVNPEIVRHGENGYLVTSPTEWLTALEKLLDDASLRKTMGAAGRGRVESDYCIQSTGPRVAHMLRLAAGGSK
jgi:glycosyltransferase involved in cell wall biosynthesis